MWKINKNKQIVWTHNDYVNRIHPLEIRFALFISDVKIIGDR